MPLPASWTLVPVTATYTRRDGTPASGRVLFRSPQILVVDDEIIVPRTIVGVLDDTGALKNTAGGTLQLPSTNDPDIAPTGWTYNVIEEIEGLVRQNWHIQVAHDSAGIDLATVAPAMPITEVTNILTTAMLGTTVARQADLTALDTRVDELEESGVEGPQGPPGQDGADGDSAYEVALANGFVGTEPAWLASLVGAQGPEGPQGDQGPQGIQGVQGVQGEPGEQGPAGADGQDGADADTVDLVATPSSQAATSLTATGHASGSTGSIFSVVDPLLGERVGVTTQSLNSNVPVACPFVVSNGIRLYLGATDPDPGAPNGTSLWINAEGVVHYRAGNAWVAAGT